jgi:hypothetical protein
MYAFIRSTEPWSKTECATGNIVPAAAKVGFRAGIVRLRQRQIEATGTALIDVIGFLHY